MTIWSNVKGADGPFYPYEINQSCMFSEYDLASRLDFSFGYQTTDQYLRYRHAFSTWVKLGGTALRYRYIFANRHAASSFFRFGIWNDNTLVLHDYPGTYRTRLETTQVFRDVTNWMHLFYIYDSTQPVASDRVKIWVNGNLITDYSTEIYPDQFEPSIMFIANGFAQGHLGAGRNSDGSIYSHKGMLAESHTIDGNDCTNFDLITVNDFGFEKNGAWIPRKYKYRGREGYGIYGGYYNYSNAGSLGKDFSGNDNDMTPFGITTINQVDDSPTNNRCILNEADAYSEADGRVRFGGLEWIYGSTTWLTIRGTMQVESGKWYYETLPIVDMNYSMVGWMWSRYRIRAVASYVGGASFPLSCCIYGNSTQVNLWKNASGPYVSGLLSVGDQYLAAIDVDKDFIWFGLYKPSTDTTIWFDSLGGYTGDPENGLNPTFSYIFGSDYKPIAPAVSTYQQSTGNRYNFGQWPFVAQPKGFRSLCSKNIEDSRIYTPTKFHSANVRSGDNVNNKLVEFNENANDFSISKSRSSVNGWVLYNRFLNENQNLTWTTGNSTFDPVTGNSGGGIGSFTKRKYKLVAGTSNMDNVNTTGYNYIDYTWGAEKSLGIQLVSYIGNGTVQQIYHNLKREPYMIWVKALDSVVDWGWYHLAMGDGGSGGWAYYALLNTGAARVSDPTGVAWNNTRPNSEYFTVGSGGFNYSGISYIAYVFAPIPGFSAFGGVGETGSTDGSTMYCGFTPKWLFHRTISTASNGLVKDTYREKNNPLGLTLVPDSAVGEYTNNNQMDVLSMGMKYRAVRTANSLSLFAAFAENPFKHSNAR